MSTKHTPLPWSVDLDMRTERTGDMYAKDGWTDYLAGYNVVSDAGEVIGCEGILAGDQGEEDANFIVLAVNAYASNQAEIARLREALSNLERYLRDTPHHNAVEAAAARKVLALEPKP